MTDMFFYGTLRHVPLLQQVLGRDDLDLRAAVLPDHQVLWAAGQSFPMIRAQAGGQAPGLLARGLSDTDLARLNFYEGAFVYDLRCSTVLCADQRVQAQVYFPADDSWTPGAPWDLAEWIAQWGRLSLFAAEEVMAHFGRVDPAQMAHDFTAIRQRAAARIAAEGRACDPDQDVAQDVVLHDMGFKALSWFGLVGADLQHRQYDGTMGPVINRGGLWQGEAAVVLPYDPRRDTVLMVQQFRAPVYMIGDPAPWMWEAVAGMVDPGETPDQTAHREAVEESQVPLNHLEYAGGAYSSSGSSTEFLHLFVGLTDLPDSGTIAGLETENEDIRSRILPFADLMDLVDTHKLKDLPLLTLANWLARHRDRLRNMA